MSEKGPFGLSIIALSVVRAPRAKRTIAESLTGIELLSVGIAAELFALRLAALSFAGAGAVLYSVGLRGDVGGDARLGLPRAPQVHDLSHFPFPARACRRVWPTGGRGNPRS